LKRFHTALPQPTRHFNVKKRGRAQWVRRCQTGINKQENENESYDRPARICDAEAICVHAAVQSYPAAVIRARWNVDVISFATEYILNCTPFVDSGPQLLRCGRPYAFGSHCDRCQPVSSSEVLEELISRGKDSVTLPVSPTFPQRWGHPVLQRQ